MTNLVAIIQQCVYKKATKGWLAHLARTTDKQHRITLLTCSTERRAGPTPIIRNHQVIVISNRVEPKSFRISLGLLSKHEYIYESTKKPTSPSTLLPLPSRMSSRPSRMEEKQTWATSLSEGFTKKSNELRGGEIIRCNISPRCTFLPNTLMQPSSTLTAAWPKRTTFYFSKELLERYQVKELLPHPD